MKKILIINTGGTFNKVYNPITGELEIEPTGEALKAIASAWLTRFNISNILAKDSLDMNDGDRELILDKVQNSIEKHIIIVHGTDTMDLTAHYLANAKLEKQIVLTGAMIPHSINPIESASNLACAYGFIQSNKKSGVFISMNGVIEDYKRVVKNKEKGYFEDSKQ
jgi:L-asparaginase